MKAFGYQKGVTSLIVTISDKGDVKLFRGTGPDDFPAGRSMEDVAVTAIANLEPLEMNEYNAALKGLFQEVAKRTEAGAK